MLRRDSVTIAATMIGALAGSAQADERVPATVHADLGLAVVGLAYEHPVAPRLAIAVEAQVFSTYFAPWFDAGDRVDGQGGEVRLTWFAHASGHGLYVAPYLRVDRVTGDNGGASGAGVGGSGGAFVGWAVALHRKLDLRIGAGAQYLRYRVDTANGPVAVETPFVALDLVVAYRL